MKKLLALILGIIAFNSMAMMNCDNEAEKFTDPIYGPVNLEVPVREEFEQYAIIKRNLTVYRGDKRPPSEIDKYKGFHSISLENNSPIRLNSRTPNKAMISTSKNLEVAASFAARDGFIYKLKLKSGQGIDLEKTLSNLRGSASRLEHNAFASEQEVLVMGDISYEQIVGVGKIGRRVSEVSIPGRIRNMFRYSTIEFDGANYYVEPVEGFSFLR